MSRLRSSIKYPNYPDGYAIMPWMESHASSFDNSYGERYEAFFTPCFSGNYSFIISGDDQHELFFADSANYSDFKSIAFSSRHSLFRKFDAMSRKLWLHENGTYLLAAEFKEGGGGDHLSVGVIKHDTNLTYFDTQQVSIENQTISISTTYLQEIQELSVYDSIHSLDSDVSFTLDIASKKTPEIYYPSFKMFSDQECFNEKNGVDYSGNIAITKSGFKCQFWNSQAPNTHSFDANSSGIGDHNYCRNPDNTSGRPWCYLALHQGWEFCDVDYCIKDALSYLFNAQCSGHEFNSRNDYLSLDFEVTITHLPPFSENFFQNSKSLIDSYCGRYSIEFKTSGIKQIYFSEDSERPYIEDTNYLCMAYKIPPGHPFVISFELQMDDGLYHWHSLYSPASPNSANFIPQGRVSVELNAIIFDNSTWIYDCFNIYQSIREHGIIFSHDRLHKIKTIEFLSIVSPALFIDVISLSYVMKNVEQISPAIHPNNLTISSIHVESQNANYGEYNLSSFKYFFNTTDCASGLPLIKASSNNNSFTVNTSRLQNASLPIKGHFSITTNFSRNHTINNLAYNINETDFLARIEQVFLKDNAKGGIAFSDNICRERKFWISFYKFPGDLEAVQVDSSLLSGNELRIRVDEVTPGGLIMAPIPGHMLRTVNRKPQINIRKSGRLASCKGPFTQNDHNLLLNSSINICDFSYTNSPFNITDIFPRDACVNSTLVISGENFGYSLSDIFVTVGNSQCEVISITNTNLTCSLPHSIGGRQIIHMQKLSYGNIPANNELTINVCLKILTVSHARGSVEGGLTITIEATNGLVKYPLVKPTSFIMVIEMANLTCEISSSNHTHVNCLTPPSLPQTVDIKVNIFESGILIGSDTLSQVFTYSLNDTPIVTDISHSSGSVLGGDVITLSHDRQFDLDIYISFDKENVLITDKNSTSVAVVTPSHPPGRVKIIVSFKSVGLAISNYSFEYRFYVCNISSSSGSLFGGQTLTILGGGFSTIQHKFQIKIGSFLCSIVSITDSIIRCVTQPTNSRYFINRKIFPNFSSIVQVWDPPVIDIHPGDEIIWSWSNTIVNNNLSLYQTLSHSAITPFKNGLKSDMSTSATFEHSFHSPGPFYYMAGGYVVSNYSNPADCYVEGEQYQGKLSVTRDSIPCLSWNSQYVRDVYLFTSPLLGNHNHCRNPENDPRGPWCFSSDSKERSYCNIQKCGFRGLINVREYLPAIESKLEVYLDNFRPKFYNSCSGIDIVETAEANAYYSYLSTQTPQVIKVTSNEDMIVAASIIELIGVNFGSDISEHKVMVGDFECKIIYLYKNESLPKLAFVIPDRIARGDYVISLHIEPFGWAFFWNNLHRITIQSLVKGASPEYGSVFGGSLLSIHGVNFNSDNISDYQVIIGNTLCILQGIVISNTSQSIICLPQPAIDDGYSSLIYPLQPISYWTFDDESDLLSDTGFLNDSTSVTLAYPILDSDDSHINSYIHARHNSALFHSNFMRTKYQQVYADFEVFAVELWLRNSSPKLMLLKQNDAFSNSSNSNMSSSDGYQFLIGNLPYSHFPGGYRLVINPCNRLELWVASGKNISEVDINECPLTSSMNCSKICSGYRQVYSMCDNGDYTIWHIIPGPEFNSSSSDWTHITFGWEIHGGSSNKFFDDPSNIGNISDCVYDGASMRYCNGKLSFIINGVVEGSENISYSPGAHVSQFFIGGIPHCPESIMCNFTGILDEIVVLSRPLTQQEALLHYNIARKGQQLIRVYSPHVDFIGTGISPQVRYPNITDNYNYFGRAFKPQPNKRFIDWKVKSYTDLYMYEDDFLIFFWKSLASLIEINKFSFDTCTISTGFIKTWSSYTVQNSVNISDLRPGDHYFTSDLEDHCHSGMKIKVAVMPRPPLRNRISLDLVLSNGLVFSYQRFNIVITNISNRTLTVNEMMVLNIIGNFSLTDIFTIFIGSTVVNETTLTSENISFLIPNMEAGEYALKVKVNNLGYIPFNTSTNLAYSIILEISPFITMIDPNSGSLIGGTVISLMGLGLSSSYASVSVEGIHCSILTSNLKTIVCQVVPSSEQYQDENVSVSVVINGFSSNYLDFSFSLSQTPKISSIFANTSLLNVVSGSNLTIQGTHLSGNTIVRITELTNTFVKNISRESVACPLNSYYMEMISCTVPTLPGGYYNLLIDVPGSGFASFIDISPEIRVILVISKIEPNRIGTGGGALVIISGSGFLPSQGHSLFPTLTTEKGFEVMQVYICEIKCEIVMSTESLIHVIAPKITSNSSQLCNVSVHSNSVISVLNSSISLDASYNGVIDMFTPTFGGTGGRTFLSINGFGFGNVIGEVIIGSSNCSISSWNDSLITCITGTHRTDREASVSVNIPNVGVATHSNLFYSYIDRWSSNFTWGGSNPPIQGETVYIPKSFVVLLDVSPPQLNLILIEGELIFEDEQDINLTARYIVINGGKLQIGTQDNHFMHRAEITLYGNILDPGIPLYGSKVLAVRQGGLDIHGKPRNRTWTRLNETANANQKFINVQDPVQDWHEGDQIVIAPTGKDSNETETLEIYDVTENGTTIILTESLKYSHLGITDTYEGGRFIDLRAEVGLLSHNVILQGSLISPSDPRGIESDLFGGHLMVFRPKPDPMDIRLSHLEVRFMGQAFRLGRYSIHFHLSDRMNGSYVRHCSIHHSFNRAITAHGVEDMLFDGIVAFDIQGHAFFVEDGIEFGNKFLNNLGILVRGSSSLLNTDQLPAVFWITNPNNTFENNAAVGSRAYGFWYDLDPRPSGPSAIFNVCPNKNPFGGFKNNVAHSNAEFGLRIWETYDPHTIPCSGGSDRDTATLYNLTAYSNGIHGVEFSVVGHVTVDGFKLADNRDNGIEISETVGECSAAEIKNTLIISRTRGNTQLAQSGAIKTMRRNFLRISNVTFVNFNENNAACLRACSHCKEFQGGFEVEFQGITFLGGSERRIASFQWEHETLFKDLDGTLTGEKPGSIVIPHSKILPSDLCNFSVPEFSLNLNGSVCSPRLHMVRLAWNQVEPQITFTDKEANFTNEFGSTLIPWRRKRLTHSNGYMILLPANYSYSVNYGLDKEEGTDITFYRGSIYNMVSGDYIILSQQIYVKPNHWNIRDESKGINNHNSTLPNANSYDATHLSWFYDNATETLTYLLKGESDTDKCTPRAFSVIREPCPVDENGIVECEVVAPIDGDYEGVPRFWSKPESWPSGSVPSFGEDVIINSSWIMYLDISPPQLGKLFIFGQLIFNDTQDINLTAAIILIQGNNAHLIIGTSISPFQHRAVITLVGNRNSDEISLSRNINLGSKALGIFGNVSIFGEPNIRTFAKLNESVNSGSFRISLDTDALNWSVGDSIAIAASGYNADETETNQIVAINGNTITLKDPLRYSHLYQSLLSDENMDDSNNTDWHASIVLAAEVALLSRNVIIQGGEDSAQPLEEFHFGCRILSGKYSTSTSVYVGHFKIDSVEIRNCGQGGFFSSRDPRYSFAVKNGGDSMRDSFITRSAIHHGYNTGIGIHLTNGIQIRNNVVYRTVDSGIRVGGTSNIIEDNLVMLVSSVLPGQPSDKHAVDFPAAFEVEGTHTLKRNIAAGSYRLGFKISGDSCGDQDTQLVGENIAHTTWTGMLITGTPNNCTAIKSFISLWAWNYGIFSQTASSLFLSRIVIVVGKIGLNLNIFGPDPIKHLLGRKFVHITNSLIIGALPNEPCDEAMPVYFTQNTLQPSNDKSGIMMSYMNRNSFKIFKIWHRAQHYPVIDGDFRIINTTFVNFKDRGCRFSDYSVTNNPASPDAVTPLSIQNTKKIDVDEKSLMFFYPPNPAWIVQEDCVDMDCDGPKHALIRDLDGSFTSNFNIRTTLIPVAELRFDESKIPRIWRYNSSTEELVDPSILAPVDFRGIARGIRLNGNMDNPTVKGCSFIHQWNGYKCNNIDHYVLVIESMDPDTEIRRLSPIALNGGNIGNGRYTDLINGPMDHGWCTSYTCLKRLSTFFTIVISGTDYTIWLSSTNPSHIRFHLLNSDDDPDNLGSVVIKILYDDPLRKDIYVDGELIPPLNLMENNYRAIGNQYIPTHSHATGSNYFNYEERLMHLLVKGSNPVSVRTANVVQLSFNLEVSLNSFFDPAEFFNNLVSVLNIDTSTIRIVNVISERSGRKRRQTFSMDQVIIEIGYSAESSIDTPQAPSIAEQIESPNSDSGLSSIDAEANEPANEIPTNPPELAPLPTTDIDNDTTIPTAREYAEDFLIQTQQYEVDSLLYNQTLSAYDEITSIADMLVTLVQTNNLNIANANLIDLTIDPPAPPIPPPPPLIPPSYANITTGNDEQLLTPFEEISAEMPLTPNIGQSIEIRIPSSLNIIQQPNSVNGHLLYVITEVRDSSGNVISQLGLTELWICKAILNHTYGQASSAPYLSGETEVAFSNGRAEFTRLRVNRPAESLHIYFITTPGDLKSEFSTEFEVITPPLTWPRITFSFRINGNYSIASTIEFNEFYSFEISKIMDVDLSRIQGLIFSESNNIIMRAQLLEPLTSDPPNVPTSNRALMLLQTAIDTARVTVRYNDHTFSAVPLSLTTDVFTTGTNGTIPPVSAPGEINFIMIIAIIIGFASIILLIIIGFAIIIGIKLIYSYKMRNQLKSLKEKVLITNYSDIRGKEDLRNDYHLPEPIDNSGLVIMNPIYSMEIMPHVHSPATEMEFDLLPAKSVNQEFNLPGNT